MSLQEGRNGLAKKWGEDLAPVYTQDETFLSSGPTEGKQLAQDYTASPGRVAQWLECQPKDPRVMVSIRDQGHVPQLQA